MSTQTTYMSTVSVMLLEIHSSCTCHTTQLVPFIAIHILRETIYIVSQYTIHLTFDHNFRKCKPIFKIFFSQIFKKTLCNCYRVFHLTLITLLHYLVKPKNHNCCQFQWLLACDTSEFILLDMRPP